MAVIPFRVIEKIIDLDSTKPVLNWNYYCVSPDESDDNRQLAINPSYNTFMLETNSEGDING